VQEIGLNGYEIVEPGGSVFLIKILLQRGLSTKSADLAFVERWAVREYGDWAWPFVMGRAGWWGWWWAL